MKRISTPLKTLLSLALVLALLLVPLAPAAWAATAETVQHYDTYMCLGDSIAAGFTVSGNWRDLLLHHVSGAYHDIIAKATGAELRQFGWSCFRTQEVLYMLEDQPRDPNEVWMTDKFVQSCVSDALLDAHKADFVEAVRTSDLITVNLGSNDVLSSSVYETVVAVQNSEPSVDQERIDKLKERGGFAAALAEILRQTSSVADRAKIVATLLQRLSENYAAFTRNFNRCMKDILELNPDATIVVVGMFNPYESLYLNEEGTLTMAPLVQPVVDLVNVFLRRGCAYADRYLYAQANDVKTWHYSLANPDIADMVFAIHPTAEGHATLAQAILAVLPEEVRFPFTDVKPENWFYEDVREVWEQGLMAGVSSTLFAPKHQTTRAQFVSVLWRLAGSPEVSKAQELLCPFTDLKDGWYRPAVLWAFSKGIVGGTTLTTFSPKAPLTREQLVSMLWRYGGSPSLTLQVGDFTDGASISLYARPAVAWAVKNEIVFGLQDGTFHPKDPANRAQLAAVLRRFCRAE